MDAFDLVHNTTLTSGTIYTHALAHGTTPFVSIDPGDGGAGVVARKNPRFPMNTEVLYFHPLTDDYEGVMRLADAAIHYRAPVVIMEAQYIKRFPLSILKVARNAEKFITTFALLWMHANKDNPEAPALEVYHCQPSLWQSAVLPISSTAKRGDRKQAAKLLAENALAGLRATALYAADTSLIKGWNALTAEYKSGVADAYGQAACWAIGGGIPKYRKAKRKR